MHVCFARSRVGGITVCWVFGIDIYEFESPGLGAENVSQNIIECCAG